MPAALEVEQLSKRFGPTRALDGVTWAAEAGSAVLLLGPNGAGKTTLLGLCATLLRPSGGRVRLFGLDTAQHGPAVRRRLAVLGHESFLYPDLSARENLRFYARLYGVADAVACIDALIERLGIAGWSHRPVRVLSRGMLQRCALARVLLHAPDLLLLDEPFTGLDLAARDLLCEVLGQAHRQGTTLLMSTHELELGFRLCTDALVLAGGRVAWQGGIATNDHARIETMLRELAPRQEPRGRA
jgi:heme ABC exporter ATP-binding subunit CcmA